MALVRGVIADSTAAGSRLKVCRSTSANTGIALASTTAEAVEMNVYGGTMTSSSARMPGRHQCNAQRNGAIDHRDAVRAAVHRRETLLEL